MEKGFLKRKFKCGDVWGVEGYERENKSLMMRVNTMIVGVGVVEGVYGDAVEEKIDSGVVDVDREGAIW